MVRNPKVPKKSAASFRLLSLEPDDGRKPRLHVFRRYGYLRARLILDALIKIKNEIDPDADLPPGPAGRGVSAGLPYEHRRIKLLACT